MLFRLGAESQFVDVVEDLAEVVAAGDLVSDLAEDFADLVFNGVRPAAFLFEGFQVGEQLVVDKVPQVVAGAAFVVVNLAVRTFRGGPFFPPEGLVEDPGIFLAFEFSFGGFVLFEPVEVFQEQQPGTLLGVVEFRGAASFLPEDVVNVFEGLFEHGGRWSMVLL